MMMIKVGIAGCSDIVNGKHMPNSQKVESVEMIAFCDVDISKAANAAETYGTDNAKVYDDYKALLKDDTIDVIHVCTPNDLHCEIAVAGLHAGKHVMCEKPMVKTTTGAQKMVDIAKSTGKKLTIGYQNRFQADSQFLHQAAQRGGLGDIYFRKAHATRRRVVPTRGVFPDEETQGGGPLIDIGTYTLDLTLRTMDNYEPESVMGSTFHKLSKQRHTANVWGSWNPDEFTVEDSAFGFIRMKNGVTIILESAWAINSLEVDEAEYSLSGTKAGADMKDGPRIHGKDMGTLYTEHVELENKGVDFYEGNKANEAEEEAKVWIDAVVSDTEPVVKPGQAMVATKILEAIYQPAKSGKAIYFE